MDKNKVHQIQHWQSPVEIISKYNPGKDQVVLEMARSFGTILQDWLKNPQQKLM